MDSSTKLPSSKFMDAYTGKSLWGKNKYYLLINTFEGMSDPYSWLKSQLIILHDGSHYIRVVMTYWFCPFPSAYWSRTYSQTWWVLPIPRMVNPGCYKSLFRPRAFIIHLLLQKSSLLRNSSWMAIGLQRVTSAYFFLFFPL